MSPRANYYQRLDYYGSSKNLSLYPMASTTDWNAMHVMLSYDERSIYVFFSHTFDFIGKCSLGSPNITDVAPIAAPRRTRFLHQSAPISAPRRSCQLLRRMLASQEPRSRSRAV